MLVWKGHKAKVRSLAFSPNGRFLASAAGNSQFAWLWESTTGKLIYKLKDNYWPTRAIAFLPDGRHLVGLHHGQTVTVWDVETGAVVSKLQTSGWIHTEMLALSVDGARLVVFTNGLFAEWDDPARPSSQPRPADRMYSNRHGYTFPFLYGFSPKGTYFWRTAGSLVLYAADLKTERRQFTDPDNASAAGCSFTPDESRVCVAFGHRAVVWRLDDPQEPPVKLRGHKQQVRTVGFLPGGGTVLTAAMDGTVRLWDADTGTEQRSFDWGIGKVRVAVVSPDGTMCAAGSDDGQLVVWDVDV